MPFLIRLYSRFPVQCAVTNNSGTCLKRPHSTLSRSTRLTAIRRGAYADPHKNP